MTSAAIVGCGGSISVLDTCLIQYIPHFRCCQVPEGIPFVAPVKVLFTVNCW